MERKLVPSAVYMAVLVVFALSLSWEALQQRFTINQTAQRTLTALLSDPNLLPSVEAQWVNLSAQYCRANWFRGLIAQATRQEAVRDRAWQAAIRCSPDFIPMLYAKAFYNQNLAELAIQEQPDVANSWFWMADLRMEEAPEEAVILYHRGLLLDPTNRLRWQQLSYSFIQLDPQTARETYLDLGLANLASDEQPGSVDARFLWARILGQESPEEGAALYRELLQLRPRDGVYWRELGDLLRDHDPDAALEAYLQSCYNGDPGHRGCLHAGRVAEQLGRIEDAIRYYRLSDFPAALEQATRLEQQLNDGVYP